MLFVFDSEAEPPGGVSTGLGGLVLAALDVLVVVAAPLAPLDGPQGVYDRVYLGAGVVEAERYAHRAWHAAAVATAYFLAQFMDALGRYVEEAHQVGVGAEA